MGLDDDQHHRRVLYSGGEYLGLQQVLQRQKVALLAVATYSFLQVCKSAGPYSCSWFERVDCLLVSFRLWPSWEL